MEKSADLVQNMKSYFSNQPQQSKTEFDEEDLDQEFEIISQCSPNQDSKLDLLPDLPGIMLNLINVSSIEYISDYSTLMMRIHSDFDNNVQNDIIDEQTQNQDPLMRK